MSLGYPIDDSIQFCNIGAYGAWLFLRNGPGIACTRDITGLPKTREPLGNIVHMFQDAIDLSPVDAALQIP